MWAVENFPPCTISSKQNYILSNMLEIQQLLNFISDSIEYSSLFLLSQKPTYPW